MRKGAIILHGLVAVFVLISLGFTYTKKVVEVDEDYVVDEPINYTVSAEEEDLAEEVKPPFLGKSFNGFKEALAFKESRGDYFVVNQFGYLGKYQFGRSTLKLIGIKDTNEFLNDTELQERAFIANLERNKWVLRNYIKRYKGRVYNGIKITESGMLAAAHLAGPGAVKDYLRSGGLIKFEDGNGVPVTYYMRKFAGYDTSYIVPNKKARI
ncbi:hypothetical protein SAMN04487906_0940 [Zhouia amylolytica]|uniref:Peptidoglycan-binding protein LysM n=3 Tax=Zhouia amylolytica TaxID=376730 RepID=W2UNT5_9FLAO|nr:hypothetical protein [Zhouia amylolytica]ETN95663.1 hypothetical protein P278_13850 [Zhouia amylolytica AD3]MCQ0110853.1 peptidoglycan-binding protein LysM [Zhouia amylolytica]SFS56854.1 hypothetical protein SAMN04487906_0940 [Zhouia amylolytica]